jgi:hypothetical protein
MRTAVHALLGQVGQDAGDERRVDWHPGDAAQRGVLPAHREHREDSQ